MLVERPWRKAWPTHVVDNVVEEPEPRPLFELVTKTARQDPRRTCMKFQGATMTYGQADDLSSRFASALISLGVKKGDRVAIFMPNMPQFVLAYFGILKAGGIVVPCSPLYKPKELEFQLRDSGSSFIVAANDVVKENDLFASIEACRGGLGIRVITASLTDYLPSAKRALAGFAGVKNVPRKETVAFVDLVAKHPPLSKNADVDPRKDVAVLQYTGGTTGIAKGAMLTHANLFTNAVVISAWFPLTKDDVSLAALPFFHIYGMTAAMNASLYVGGSMVLLPRFEVEAVMKAIEKEKITTFCGVPTMYIAVINHPDVAKFSLRTVRGCISGGAPLPAAVSKALGELTGGTLVEGYGLSEASPVTHCNPMGEGGGSVKEGSIGVPIPFTDAEIVDMADPSKRLGVGEIGELAVRGPQVMLGYWNNPSETENVLAKDGWLLTGDVAKMDADGYFYIVDRKKDMIDVSGLKVYPREVEELLFTHPAVKEAAVVGMADSYRGEAVHAYVVLRPDRKGKVTEEEIIQFCRTNLATYKAPRKVTFVEELPKTLVGKVLRRRLRESHSEQAPPPSTAR